MRARLWWFACLISAAIAASVTWASLSEAYGAGPPYYGRTTNLDKWVNPFPLLLGVDGPLLVLALFCAARARRSSA